MHAQNTLLEYYATHLYVGTHTYEGISNLIEWLEAQQVARGIVAGFLPEQLLAAAA